MRNMMYPRRRWLPWLLLFALVAVPGCGPDELSSPTAVKLKALGGLYLDCSVARNGLGPASEEAFKKHLRGLPDHVLSSHGLDPKGIDAAFTSERDGEPFVVLYGIKITKIGIDSGPLVVHEKTGKNGRYLVGFANGKVELVDEARLQALKSGKD